VQAFCGAGRQDDVCNVGDVGEMYCYAGCWVWCEWGRKLPALNLGVAGGIGDECCGCEMIRMRSES
jgi:hypothetical protein